MKPLKHHAFTLGALAILAQTVSAQTNIQKIADFRISPEISNGYRTFYDYGFGPEQTREVDGAPLSLPVEFSVTSSQAFTGSGDFATDPNVRTFSGNTRIRNFNRFASAPNATPGTESVATLQFTLDLSVLEEYLASTPSASLNALELQLALDLSDEDAAYDIYLSYTNAAESINFTNISLDSGQDNYRNIWNPAHLDANTAVGDIINGSHRILNFDQTGDLDQRTDILSLYQAGVREINVVMAMASFYSGSRAINLIENAGLNADLGSGPIQIADFRLAGQYPVDLPSDIHGPLPTRGFPAASRPPVEIPTTLVIVSANQGGPITPPQDIALIGSNLVTDADPSIDINIVGANNNPTQATLTGFGFDGENGIGETDYDAFQYAAWREGDNFDITVQLDSLTSTQSIARAGLMVRENEEDDSSHVFFGMEPNGQVVLVTRDGTGSMATSQSFTTEDFPAQLRIVREGNRYDFYLPNSGTSDTPVTTIDLALSDEVFFGPAVTSFVEANHATAVFNNLPALPNPDIDSTDVSLQTNNNGDFQIFSLNRFGGQTGGMPQWVIDLSPLTGIAPDSLSLCVKFANNRAAIPFDFYLSYTNPAEGITLTPISPDNPSLNEFIFFDPAREAAEGEIINGTHKLIAKDTAVAANGDQYDLNIDLLPLLQAGVDQVALSMATNSFFRNGTITVDDASGIFIDVAPAVSTTEISVSDVVATDTDLQLTIEGLIPGLRYHLQRSPDLETDFATIAGSEFTATAGPDTVQAAFDGDRSFVRVVRGAEPTAP